MEAPNTQIDLLALLEVMGIILWNEHKCLF